MKVDAAFTLTPLRSEIVYKIDRAYRHIIYEFERIVVLAYESLKIKMFHYHATYGNISYRGNSLNHTIVGV